MGGSPAERCRSEALFLTANAKSSAMSIYNLGSDTTFPQGPPRSRLRAKVVSDPTFVRRQAQDGGGTRVQAVDYTRPAMPASSDYEPRREGVASRPLPDRTRGPARRPRSRNRRAARGPKDASPSRDPHRGRA